MSSTRSSANVSPGDDPSTGQRANRGPAAAADNRAALIQAAAEVFAERGLDAPLNAVAKRAGVGQGVLYRHFPTRESLAVEAFESNVDRLEVIVAEGGTLGDLLTKISEQAVNSVSFIALISRHPEDPRARALGQRVVELVDATLPAAQDAGTIPATFSRDDTMLAIRMATGVLSTSLPGERDGLIADAWRMLGIHLG